MHGCNPWIRIAPSTALISNRPDMNIFQSYYWAEM